MGNQMCSYSCTRNPTIPHDVNRRSKFKKRNKNQSVISSEGMMSIIDNYDMTDKNMSVYTKDDG